jgi:hypothetical protein
LIRACKQIQVHGEQRGPGLALPTEICQRRRRRQPLLQRPEASRELNKALLEFRENRAQKQAEDQPWRQLGKKELLDGSPAGELPATDSSVAEAADQ